jgi:alpha-beta hydrolase superfamily lysophospholipase
MRAADLLETTLERSQKPALFFRHYHSENEKARVVIVHGLGEHSGRYLDLADHLAAIGCSLWILDLRGHGQSGGKRGHVDSFNDYALDVGAILEQARHEKPAKTPLFLLGHSMGGLVSILVALEYQDLLNGLVLSSPAVGVAAPLPAFKKVAVKCLAVLAPRLGINNELDPHDVSRDPETVRRYMADPLVHDQVSTGWFVQFMKAAEIAFKRAAELQLPTLIQAAGADRLVSTPAVASFYGKLAMPDRSLEVYENLFHEIYNETAADREKVITALATWLTARISP